MSAIKEWMRTIVQARSNYAWPIAAAGFLLTIPLERLRPSFESALERVEAVLGAPYWALAVTLAILCLAIWMLLFATSLRKQLEPKIKVAFEPETGGLSRTILTNPKTGEYIDDAKYVRLSVWSASQRSVGECVANLVRIERRLDSSKVETLWDQDSLPLLWAMIHTYEAKIHYRAKRFVDVATVQSKIGQLQLLTVIPNRLSPNLEKHGVYILTIVVTGDGISHSVRIEVETDGTFDGLKGKPV